MRRIGYKVWHVEPAIICGFHSSFASKPDLMKEHIATGPVTKNLPHVLIDFCIGGVTAGTIIASGSDTEVSRKISLDIRVH